ncbi:uncharacterized protein LOC120270793 [Dioscorea cayenensis subsp. rotundata]|uniref:Uncharacterized protein LOC120270793 n=1 Tax=Dioscorea cayennensis subsp. rotundata TaxID=55577 RepID=A0AB40C211_DIOCR|nr:uncharacterized protein LOC120270793 [Dioscorea cayenensis subsp. rotundata]
MAFFSKRFNFSWRCTSVYGPVDRSRKQAFWDELRAVSGESMVPMVICGDFNAIFALEDKVTGVPNLEDIRCANAFLQDYAFFEPSSKGRRFTWTNGQSNPIWVKLDRFLVNGAWAERFPRLTQSSLPRLGSDHVPIRLEAGSHLVCPKPFRFEFVWTTAEGFSEIVKNWWKESSFSGCGAFILSKKLSNLKVKLKHWAKFDFGSIKLRKLDLLRQLEELDLINEDRGLSVSEQQQELALIACLEEIRKQEEIYWKQRSRLQWLKDGDENTKFFQAVANGRKNRNFIPYISKDGSRVENLYDIGKFFEAHFRLIFGQKRQSRINIDFEKLFEYKNSVDLTVLDSRDFDRKPKSLNDGISKAHEK